MSNQSAQNNQPSPNLINLQRLVKVNALKKGRMFLNTLKQTTCQGKTLSASVGRSYTYYVEIDVQEDTFYAACNCDENTDYSFCKHVAAVMLKWIEQPHTFAIKPAPPQDENAVIETYVIEPLATRVPTRLPYWFETSFAESVEKDIENLHYWLEGHTIQALRQMATKQGWSLKGTRKADLVQQIAQHLLQPDNLHKSLANLDDSHRQLFDALASLYPFTDFEMDEIAAFTKRLGSFKKTRMGSYLKDLGELGLIIPQGFREGEWKSNPFVPQALLQRLPPRLTEWIPSVELVNDSHVSLGQKRPFLQRTLQIFHLLEQLAPPLRSATRPRLEKFHEILQVWDYIPEEIAAAQRDDKFSQFGDTLQLTVPPPQSLLPERIVRQLAPIAGGETQLNFIYRLLLLAGLLQPGSPVTPHVEVKQEFLRHDEAYQWAILARAFIYLNIWSELWLLLAQHPTLKLTRASEQYYRPLPPQDMYNLLTMMRVHVLHLLANLPDNCWFRLEDIAERLRPLWPHFDSNAWNTFYHHREPQWFLTENGAPLDTAKNKEHWDKAQGSFIEQIIRGPLHWLGLADICLENNRLVAFRLQGLNELYFERAATVPLGTATADLADLSAKAAVLPPDAITIDKNTITVNPTTISAHAHTYLDGIAIIKDAAPTRFVYELDVTAVHQSFENGASLPEILDGWTKWLTIPMPSTIQTQLTTWTKAYGQVRLYDDVTVIEFGDAYALTEMKAATSLAQHIIAEISPTLVIIPINSINQLVKELEKAGYTPKQTDDI